ncbi:MAG TPA: NAD(P)H:quinone oxidoreductase, type IV [Eubacteriaceae bacterium]|nr:NAD(P)H:quinone oxidoreductase, type IV [Eubacteriaceae bacterium]
MSKVKLSIIYYSMSGANTQMVQWAKEAAEAAGAEVRLRKVQELAPQEVIDGNELWKKNVENTKDIPVATSDDIVWADALIFSSPTRFGNVASQMKQFLDIQGGIWSQGKTVNKVVSAMSSAQNPNGGQENTIKALYTTMMHWGAIIVPTGYTDESLFKAGGNPYGTTATVDGEGKIVEDIQEAVAHQARRTVEIAKWIKQGQTI